MFAPGRGGSDRCLTRSDPRPIIVSRMMPKPTRALSAPQQILRGAVIVLAIGLPALVSLASGGRSTDADVVRPALAITALLAASGGVAGALHHATRRLRRRDGFLAWCCWTANTGLVVLLLLGGARALAPHLGLGYFDLAILLELLDAGIVRPAIVIALGAGTMLAETTSGERPDEPVEVEIPVLTRPVARVFALVASLALAIGVRATGDDVELPASRDEAARLLPLLTEDAKARPDDARLQMAYGRVLLTLDSVAAAAPVLEHAVRLAPDDASAHNSLGWTLARLGRPGEALPHLRAATQLAPRWGAAHHNLGWALLLLDSLAAAEDPYRQAVRLDPEDAEATYALGWLLMRLDRSGSAEMYLRKAIALDSSLAHFHFALAELHVEKARFDSALVHLHIAASIDPDDPVIWGKIGLVEYLRQRPRDAVIAIERALAADSTYARQYPALLAVLEAARAGRTGDIDPREVGRVAAQVGAP